MLAARVLTDHFERVTIIERDHLPELFQKKLRGYLLARRRPDEYCVPLALGSAGTFFVTNN